MKQRERIAQEREHAQAQQIDLDQPEIFRSSLSHCTIVRSRIVAHSTGATFTSGSRVITMPPEWIPMMTRKAVDAPADLQQQRAESLSADASTEVGFRRRCVAARVRRLPTWVAGLGGKPRLRRASAHVSSPHRDRAA
jgi:hypothetical protein